MMFVPMTAAMTTKPTIGATVLDPELRVDAFYSSVEDMKSLLDEVRGRLRDAGSDTKEAFAAISKDAEQLARDMSLASSHAFADLIRRLRELVNRLGADLRR